MRLFRYQTWN